MSWRGSNRGANRRDFLACGVALAAGCGMPGRLRAEVSRMPARGLCAHRGGMATQPENTLPAFREALRLGAHMIEFDLRLTRDGVIALMHDAKVDRTTDGEGRFSDMTLAELRRLDAGVRKDARFAGTRIPTFEETLAIMPPNVWLNCHLRTGEAELGAAAAKAVQKANRLHQAFLAAPVEAAEAARAVVPGVMICYMGRQANTVDYIDLSIGRKAAFIQLRGKGEVDAEQVRLLKREGIKVNYYEVATPEVARRLFLAGVDFPLVDDVALFLPVARELGIAPRAN
jgi:glycerophosphoryl diester phosphodiesterase